MAAESPHPNPPLPGPDPGITGEGREGVRVKRTLPSLIGGIFSAIVAFILWLLLFGAGDTAIVILGALVAVGLGTWIRLADL